MVEVNTSTYYKSPSGSATAGAPLLDYGKLLNQGLQIEQRMLTNDARALQLQKAEQEQQKLRLFGGLIQQSVTPDGRMDYQKFILNAAKNPLTAEYVQPFIENASKQRLIDLNTTVKALELEKSKNDAVARAVGGFLATHRRTQTDPAGNATGFTIEVTPEELAKKLADPLLATHFPPKKAAMVLAEFSKMQPKERSDWILQTGLSALDASKAMDLALPKPTIAQLGTKAQGVVASPLTGTITPVGEPLEKEIRDPALQNKISVMTENVKARYPGISEARAKELASGLATGMLVTRKDEVSGRDRLYDVLSGAPVDEGLEAGGVSRAPPSAPIVPSVASTSSPVSDLGPSRDLYGSAAEATGLVPGAQELITRILPQIETAAGATGTESFYNKLTQQPYIGRLAKGYPEVVELRQALRLEQNNLIRALQNNPRFAEGEAKRISKEIDIDPSVVDSPTALRSRMKEVDSNLRQRLALERRVFNDKNAPVDSRKHAYNAIQAIERFLHNLNVPRAAEELTREEKIRRLRERDLNER